ncbi:MAG: hypothetical protein IJV06_01280, partial [Bacteroidaceae bacterium]|nr:hypothetical protein [Bacteroidaceae bacterium]
TSVTFQLGSSGSSIDCRISSADFIQHAKVQYLLRITAYQHKILQNRLTFGLLYNSVAKVGRKNEIAMNKE